VKIIRSGRKLFVLIASLKARGKSIGFVPTMGYLHEGHLSLFRRARRENDCVVVSIFVNPTQFGPKEDFKQYPRDMKRDLRLCKKEKVDFVFTPSVKTMYPEGFETYVEPGKLAESLCGRSRPGHFRGVATVVTKLFNQVQSTVAYLGQKDYQQALIIQRLAADLNLPVRVKICPIVRDPSGLALSSRNVHLDSEGRQRALALVRAIRWFRKEVKKGSRDVAFLKKGVRRILVQGVLRIDYAEILDARELSPAPRLSGKIVLALAAFVPAGKKQASPGGWTGPAGSSRHPRSGQAGREVRLIDNCLVQVF